MTEMGGIYGTSEVCLNGTKWSDLSDDGNKCLPLEPGLTEIMADSDDYELRSYVWKVLFLITQIYFLSIKTLVLLWKYLHYWNKIF